MKKILLIFFLLPAAFTTTAQDSAALPEKFTVAGYLKDLQTLAFDKDFKHLVSGNLVHNRINIKWSPSVRFTAIAEFRNRLFWGEQVKLTPGFISLLRNNNELLNMQKAWINNESLILHTNTERLYVDYRNSKFNIRMGRQRINWGIATTWNPNDIFNTYNFLDFDYEERPGVDGAKLQYVFKNATAELAYSNTGSKKGNIAALKYAFNKWNYDMQFISGWYKDHFTLGMGWAGYIKDAGVKGELQYFFKTKDSADHLNITIEGDYMFKEGWYINAGLLFNSHGLFKSVQSWNTISLKLSPENLMPTKWNVLVTAAKEFTPLLSANLSVLYAPGANLLILFPSIQYNLSTNLDLNLVWQSFFAELNNHFGAISNNCYLRLKWSF